MTIRVLLADDHRMFRETLAALLAEEADIQVIGDAGCGEELIGLLQNKLPDLVILDIGLPDIRGTELAKYISTIYPTVSIVALSGYAEKLFVDEMLKNGARAYVVKSAGFDELVQAIRSVHQGYAFLSPEIAATLLPQFSKADSNDTSPLSILGKREQEVLALIAQGLRSSEIAHALSIAIGTVNVHRRNIKSKLGLHTIAELTRYAIQQGIGAV